jgi:Ca-activated chloride channel family protein
MSRTFYTPTLKVLALAVVGSALLAACAPAAPVREGPPLEAPESKVPRRDAPAAPVESAKPTQAPYSAGQGPQDSNRRDVPAAPPAPAGAVRPVTPQENRAPAGSARTQPGPKEIAVDESRLPVEPTSVAAPEQPQDTVFKDYGVNPPIDPQRDPQSTFALDVDTASYAIARKYVNDGLIPPYQAIRAEEFINYFVQDYTPPQNSAFAIYADGAPSPFQRDSHVMRVGIQAFRVSEQQRKPAALTFVIDISGSMNRDNRLGLVKRSLELLVDRLDAGDSVAIVVYGDSARVHLGATRGDRKTDILNAIYALRPEGSTNTEAGLRLGYQLAAETHLRNGINRVVLCSDGVANVGNTEPVSLINSVKGSAPDDVTLTTIGFGMDNYNDVLMEQLSNKGNGFYAYIDTIEEARTMFLDRLTNSLQVVARDAKVQVEFDANTVASYRLIGYENRAVADQDFRNDSVDAGELNSGHNATAIYAVQLRPGARGRISTVRLRWQDADTREIREISGEFNSWDLAGSFEQASPRYRLNVVVAEYAEILRRSPYTQTSLRQLNGYARALAAELNGDSDVQEFARLVEAVSRME